jgi:predicted acetyltransferase
MVSFIPMHNHPMNIQILKASAENKQVILNLMQLYMYDFSEYTGSDVEVNGLFAAYPHFEDYWREENQRFPYVLMLDKVFIGFVFVRRIETQEKSYFSIAEFFIMRKYRRKGFGSSAAKEIFNLHRGEWEVFQMKANKPAQDFWKAIIAEYTNGLFVEKTENNRIIQQFDNHSFN